MAMAAATVLGRYLQRRRMEVRQVPLHCRPQLLEILHQRAAIGTVLHVPFDVGRGYRVYLIIEIGLHAKGFSALHEAPRRCVATIAFLEPRARAKRDITVPSGTLITAAIAR